MKHVRTLANGQQRQAPVGAPRSGGRTVARTGGSAARTGGAAALTGGSVEGRRRSSDARAERDMVTEGIEHPVDGAVALKPRRRPTTPGGGHPADAGLRVAPPAPVSAPRTPFVVLVLLLVIAGVVGILVLSIKINANQFELSNLEQRQKSLDIDQGRLEKEIADKEAPGTLAGQAAEAGMKPPSNPPTFIVLPNGRQLGVPRPAIGK